MQLNKIKLSDLNPNRLFTFCVSIILFTSLAACGQKGPLEVEMEPKVQAEAEEQQPTR